MGLFCIFVFYIVFFLSAIISCRFLILFSASRNRTHYYAIYTAVTILSGCISLYEQPYMPQVINQVISILLVIAFTRFILKTGWDSAVLASILNGAVFGIYNTAAFAFSGILYKETSMSESWITALNSAAILLLSAVTLEVVLKRYGKLRAWGGKYSILYICPLTFIYFVTQILINIAYNPVRVIENRLHYRTSTIQNIEVLFVIGISLISIYAIMHFYEKVMGQIEAENRMSALEAYTEMQKQYILESKQKYEKTNAFRHDIRNHIVTLTGLVENSETKKAKEYLKRFENEARRLSFEVFTGNGVIDVLFKEKLGFAKEQGIKVLCDVSIPQDFRIDDFDLCIIFFNALDNAIKACACTSEKWIDVAAKKNREFYVIDILNSFHPSSYEKGTGIGLKTIKFITEKYGGYLEINAGKDSFRLSILFPME